jgi:hypothetical protein
MESMEKLNNLQPEKPEEQIVEGFVGEYQDWQKKLPADIQPEMVELLLGNDGLWHWHLRADYIKDDQERKKYEIERKQW